MIQVKAPQDMPLGKHYVVLVFGSYTTDDGWPGNDHSEVLPEYHCTKDRDEWIAFIKECEAARSKPYGFKPYVSFVAEIMPIERTITVPSDPW